MTTRPREPLAARMRPTTLEEFFGQQHLMAEGLLLSDALQSGDLPSLILWGPPGVGKTTLAHLLATHIDAELIALSAVLSNIKEMRAAIAHAQDTSRMFSRRSILFVDEIHRFNKAQQDALLPHVENGDVILLGATTENPNFEVNQALRSRTQILHLEALDEPALIGIMRRALSDETRGLGTFGVQINAQAERALVQYAGGDARAALGALELAARRAWARAHRDTKEPQAICITPDDVIRATGAPQLAYDRRGAQHFNVTSALIKSMRGSDPDAALYYMWRMIQGGEDPAFVLRRLIIFASEDIGLADSQALVIAQSALAAYQHIGMPEAKYTLTHATLYLALAPKSSSVTTSMHAARELAKSHATLSPPTHLQQPSPTKDYQSPHHHPTGYLGDVDYLPEEIARERVYHASVHGDEPSLTSWCTDLTQRQKP